MCFASPTRIETLRFSFLQNLTASSDVIKLKSDPTHLQPMPHFYANALEAWHIMNPIVNPNIQSAAHLRRTPVRTSSLLTPNICGHTLVSEEAWTTLHVFYVGDLLMENGHCKLTEDINIDRCTIPGIGRLAANLQTAQAFSFIANQTYHCRSIL